MIEFGTPNKTFKNYEIYTRRIVLNIILLLFNSIAQLLDTILKSLKIMAQFPVTQISYP